jgi:hypothetical protein
LSEARSDHGIGVSGECLAALFRGDDSEQADCGAILIAEALYIFRKQNTKK